MRTLPLAAGCLATVLCLLAGAAQAADERTWFLELDNAVEYGPIDGFVQIPAGGTPGSTSLGRPTLDELCIDAVVFYELAARGGWRGHTLLGGARIIRLSGDAVLATDLTTHQVTYPAGTRLGSDIGLDWYSLGYGYRFELPFDWGLSITPAADVVLLDFAYEVRSDTVETSRDFAKLGYRLGGELEWSGSRSLSWLSLRASAFGGLPIDDTPHILTVEGLARARVWQAARAQLGVFLGVAYERIEYRDEQTVPNEIEARLGPLLKTGVSVAF